MFVQEIVLDEEVFDVFGQDLPYELRYVMPVNAMSITDSK
jgi:hypothetical protein